MTAARDLMEPPRDMVAPDTIQTVMTVGVGVVLALLLVGITVLCVRKRTPLYLLIVAGGAICMFNETALDVLGHCYFPEHNDWQVYQTLGRPVPLWVAFSYVAYFGGLTALWVFSLRRGLNRRQIWIGLLGIEALNCLLELPPLKNDLYTYYGEQPLRIAGVFPAVWLVFNCVGSFLAATILVRALPWLRGPRLLFVVLIPPVCQHAAFWLGVPYVAAINSDASRGVMVLAALVTLALGVLVLHTLVDLVADRGESGLSPTPAATPTAVRTSTAPIPALRR
jgi:hypothetical protein